MKNVWFESFYDPGMPIRAQEDGVISSAYPFFGVIDAYSEPHGPSHPQKRFNETQTAGQVVRAVIENSIALKAFPNTCSISRTMEEVNDNIAKWRKAIGAWNNYSSSLMGASFLIGRIDQHSNFVEIAQGGDCSAVVLFKSGKTEVIWGARFHSVEVKRHQKIAEILARPQVAGDKGKMWDSFYYELCESRRKTCNIVYPILDGQSILMDIFEIKTFPLDKIKMIISFTDGFVGWEERPDWKKLSFEIADAFQGVDGFRQILEETRKIEKQRKKESHKTFAEATCQVVHLE